MEAMILAAGAGTRLRPLTDDTPKALIRVGDRPLLGRVMDRLIAAGVDRIIVNTHFHEDQIVQFIDGNTPAEVDIAISPEPDGPYDTGGGLFAASHLFWQNKPFLLHNVDVLSRIPLRGLLDEHGRARVLHGAKAVATLAVQTRQASRRLLFDDKGLMGWENTGSDRALQGSQLVRQPVGQLVSYSFTGIHVVEPGVFQLSYRSGAFSMIALYLELAARGYVITAANMSQYDWIDVGTPERLAEANRLTSG